MKIIDHRVAINWRKVHSSLIRPYEHIQITDECIELPNNLSLFLPAECILDVREIRDWLHDKAYSNGRYNIFGCYRTERTKYKYTSQFRGIIVVFRRAVDVFHFRLFWNTNLLEAA